MSDKPGAMNNKAPWSGAGSVGGSALGFALADLLITLFTTLGWTPSETNQTSITVIVMMIAGGVGAFFTAYMTPSGLTVEQQTADLQVAKAVAKVVEKAEEKEAEKKEAEAKGKK